MTTLVNCERWFDGTFWSATVPEQWRVRRDFTIRGFPYVFESPADSRMQVGTSKNVELSGYDYKEAPEDIRSDDHRKAYLITLVQARNDPSWAWRDFPKLMFSLARRRAIMKRQVGALVGFTYDGQSENRKTWAGHFSAQPWMLYVYFSAPSGMFEADSETALLILASFTFHASNHTIERDAPQAGRPSL
jgi:hypothetical protein